MQRCRLLTSFQEGLEGDRVRDRVQRCHFLTVFKKVHTRNCSYKGKKYFFQNSASKMANSIVVDIVKYLY